MANGTAFESQEGKINFCILSGGGFRASLNAGNITAGDVFSVLPYGNSLAIKKMTGADILGSLEWGEFRTFSDGTDGELVSCIGH